MKRSIHERFWAKVDKTPGHGPKGKCWVWTASKNKKGYGRFGKKKAHRVAYELRRGPIPEGMILLHSCDFPSCVKVTHLTVGTHLLNKHDCMKKKRHAYGERHGRAKISEEEANEIRRLAKKKVPKTEIASLFGLHVRSVYRIIGSDSGYYTCTIGGDK
jgi:hypothetical protein